jgi:hypothetical protein
MVAHRMQPLRFLAESCSELLEARRSESSVGSRAALQKIRVCIVPEEKGEVRRRFSVRVFHRWRAEGGRRRDNGTFTQAEIAAVCGSGKSESYLTRLLGKAKIDGSLPETKFVEICHGLWSLLQPEFGWPASHKFRHDFFERSFDPLSDKTVADVLDEAARLDARNTPAREPRFLLPDGKGGERPESTCEKETLIVRAYPGEGRKQLFEKLRKALREHQILAGQCDDFDETRLDVDLKSSTGISVRSEALAKHIQQRLEKGVLPVFLCHDLDLDVPGLFESFSEVVRHVRNWGAAILMIAANPWHLDDATLKSRSVRRSSRIISVSSLLSGREKDLPDVRRELRSCCQSLIDRLPLEENVAEMPPFQSCVEELLEARIVLKKQGSYMLAFSP